MFFHSRRLPRESPNHTTSRAFPLLIHSLDTLSCLRSGTPTKSSEPLWLFLLVCVCMCVCTILASQPALSITFCFYITRASIFRPHTSDLALRLGVGICNYLRAPSSVPVIVLRVFRKCTREVSTFGCRLARTHTHRRVQAHTL